MGSETRDKQAPKSRKQEKNQSEGEHMGKEEKGAIILLFSSTDSLEGICIESATDKQAEPLRNFLEENFGGQFIKVSGTLIHEEGK